MTYVDTSVLLAMFLNESKTGDAWGWFSRQAPGSTLISKWTLTACRDCRASGVHLYAGWRDERCCDSPRNRCSHSLIFQET